MLINVTAAGQITPAGDPPYFVAIDRALRDDGTSYHCATPETFAEGDPRIVEAAVLALTGKGLRVHVGTSWTTDEPFRETQSAIATARGKGGLAAEMEAAALCTFARKRDNAVLCLAHVTNTTGLTDQDFETGEADGTAKALLILETLSNAL